LQQANAALTCKGFLWVNYFCQISSDIFAPDWGQRVNIPLQFPFVPRDSRRHIPTARVTAFGATESDIDLFVARAVEEADIVIVDQHLTQPLWLDVVHIISHHSTNTQGKSIEFTHCTRSSHSIHRFSFYLTH